MRPQFTRQPPRLPRRAKPCPCCQWRPLARDHLLGLCPECRVCLHCEQQPTTTRLGLCAGCAANPQVSVLYRRDAAFDPAWEQHLRQLTRWYQQELAAEGMLDPPAAAGA